MIVIVFGLPGSGKSYFAERLAAKMDCEYVNSDRLRKEMFSTRTYSAEEKNEVYTRMQSAMRNALLQKKDIVIDATFHRDKTRKAFLAAAGEKGKVAFIEIIANEQTVRERLKKSRPHSEADFEVYQLIRQQWEPLDDRHLTLESTDHNIEYMLQKAAVYLQQQNDK